MHVPFTIALQMKTFRENYLSNSVKTSEQLKSCIYKFYGCFNPKIIFRNTLRIKSFFPYKDRLSRSLRSKVVYKASSWDCDDCYIGKTKRRLHDRKTKHFKTLTCNSHYSAVADHMTQTGHRVNGITLRF